MALVGASTQLGECLRVHTVLRGDETGEIVRHAREMAAMPLDATPKSVDTLSDRRKGWRMTTMRAIAMVALPILAAGLGGCTKKDDPTDTLAASNFTPPQTRAPTPLPGQAQTNPLTAYIGKYPHDAVGGVDFYDRTDVASGLVTAVGDAKLREMIRGRSGPATPVFKMGERVAAWGCEEHNCGDHNWTVIVDSKAGKTQVCYHDAAKMGTRSDWYDGAAPVRRAETCPSEG